MNPLSTSAKVCYRRISKTCTRYHYIQDWAKHLYASRFSKTSKYAGTYCYLLIPSEKDLTLFKMFDSLIVTSPIPSPALRNKLVPKGLLHAASWNSTTARAKGRSSLVQVKNATISTTGVVFRPLSLNISEHYQYMWGCTRDHKCRIAITG